MHGPCLQSGKNESKLIFPVTNPFSNGYIDVTNNKTPKVRLAKDLTQETFLKAYESMERFDGSCKISTWLCQIAKHLLYRHWEREGVRFRRSRTRQFLRRKAPKGRCLPELNSLTV